MPACPLAAAVAPGPVSLSPVLCLALSPWLLFDDAPHMLGAGQAHSQGRLQQAADWHKGAQFCPPIHLHFPPTPWIEKERGGQSRSVEEERMVG